MTTLAVIGAGRGLGAAVARRFGREGFDVALISRNRDRARSLAADLGDDGVSAHGFAADVRRPDELTATLEAVAETVGPIEVLQYSPIPQKDFMRPVLETTPADLVGPVEFSIYGPVAAVHQVLPGMRFLGAGTILFVNGGSAVRPAGRVTGTSIAFAGQSAYAQILHDEVAADGVHVAQLIIPGRSSPVTRGRTRRSSPRPCGACTATGRAFVRSPRISTPDVPGSGRRRRSGRTTCVDRRDARRTRQHVNMCAVLKVVPRPTYRPPERSGVGRRARDRAHR